MKNNENQCPFPTNVKLGEIGIWSEIKMAILREYAHVFTTILKTKSWCRGCCYIDAFAGDIVRNGDNILLRKETAGRVGGGI